MRELAGQPPQTGATGDGDRRRSRRPAEPPRCGPQLDDAVVDPARLAALRDLGVLDTAAEEDFDRYTRLASELLGVPVSLVSLVDADRQFFKSGFGLSGDLAHARQTPLSHSSCQHAVAAQGRWSAAMRARIRSSPTTSPCATSTWWPTRECPSCSPTDMRWGRPAPSTPTRATEASAT